MPANVEPIFPLIGNVDWITGIVTANTTADITSGTSYKVFTAGANGSFLKEIRLKANPANNTAATVLRIWINNGSSPAGAAANSVLFAEINIPSTTASNNSALNDFVCPMNIDLDANFEVYLTIGTAPGGSGAFSACAVGKNY